MKFKQGDIVWCIDRGNNKGTYCITSYHKKCLVVGYSIDGLLNVKVTGGQFVGRIYQVVESFFELANRKARVV